MKLKTIHWRAAATTALVGLALPAGAAEAVVSGCSGVSLPRSAVTEIMRPVVQGVVAPLESSVNGILDTVGNLPLIGTLPGAINTNATGLLDAAASGQPISLSVVTTAGTLVGPSDDCVATSDAVTLDDEAGIAIGGNRISGLGQNGAVAKAGGLDSIAVGNDAATAAGAIGAIAIGTDASATAGNSVALGAGARTQADLSAQAYRPDAAPVSAEAALGEVSIGTQGGERRLTNLAAGAQDTDAVNVSQLRGVDARAATIDNRVTVIGGDVDVINNNVSNLDNRVTTIGDQVTSIDNRVTRVDDRVGDVDARVTNVDGRVTNLDARVTSVDGRVTTLGNRVTNVDGRVTNLDARVTSVDGRVTTLGNRVTGVDNRVTAVDARVTNVVTDVATVKTRVTDLERWSIRYDGENRTKLTLGGEGGTTITNVRAGAISATSTDAVNGAQLSATNQALAELSQLSVVYDTDAAGRRVNGVTLKGGNGGSVRVHNVGRGEKGTDAANIDQLREEGAAARQYSNTVAQAAYDQSRSYTDQQVGGVSARLDGMDARLHRVSARIDGVEDQARQAAAIGLAAASLRFDDRPGKFSMGVSGGTWRGESAFATGVGYTNESGRLRLNATASVADGEVGGGAGLSFTFN